MAIIDKEGYIQHRHVDLTDESVLHEEIVEIIPEFGTWTSITFAFLALTLVASSTKKKNLKTPIQ